MHQRFLPFLNWRMLGLSVLALGLGCAQAWAFAPRTAWWLGLLALTGFVLLMQGAVLGKRAAAWLGFLYGAAWFGSGIWWLYISLHTYGELPAWIAAPAVMAFASVMAMFPALVAVLLTALHAVRGLPPRPILYILGFASLWALSEWLRGTLFTGFPWLASGYAQIDGPFAAFAPWLGVYGISWVHALVAASLASLGMTLYHRSTATRREVVSCVSLLLISGLLTWGARQVQFTMPVAGKPLQVRLLQGNVPQETKFELASLAASVKLYEAMLTAAPADLIVTPETAFPLLIQEIPQSTLDRLYAFSQQHQSAILFGAAGADSPVDFTNSVFGIRPQASPQRERLGYDYRYNKHHLVPFGEFIPWGFRWFLDLMKMPMGDFMRGHPVQAPFEVRGLGVAANICYEDAFGEELALMMRDNLAKRSQDVHVLINLTNIGWFGNTEALDQHLQISRMRSLELGRPMLRATNTGATAIIDAAGKVLAQLPPFTQGTLVGQVQGRTGHTPFTKWGNAPVLVLALSSLTAFFFCTWRERRRKTTV